MFKPKDKIIDINRNPGVVHRILTFSDYPIYVTFNNGENDFFTVDGRKFLHNEEPHITKL